MTESSADDCLLNFLSDVSDFNKTWLINVNETNGLNPRFFVYPVTRLLKAALNNKNLYLCAPNGKYTVTKNENRY
jgi:hypothetical protein